MTGCPQTNYKVQPIKLIKVSNSLMPYNTLITLFRPRADLLESMIKKNTERNGSLSEPSSSCCRGLGLVLLLFSEQLKKISYRDIRKKEK